MSTEFQTFIWLWNGRAKKAAILDATRKLDTKVRLPDVLCSDPQSFICQIHNYNKNNTYNTQRILITVYSLGYPKVLFSSGPDHWKTKEMVAILFLDHWKTKF